MADKKIKVLTAKNGVSEYMEEPLTDDNLPESMKSEFEDGKGGED